MPRNPTPESFRAEVERRVSMAGTTDEARATAIGVSRQTLDAWRKGGNLRLSQLAALARASGQPLALYFDADTEREPDPIEWDRLSGWLSSIQAMVNATLPDDPDPEATKLVTKAAGDSGTPRGPDDDDAPGVADDAKGSRPPARPGQ